MDTANNSKLFEHGLNIALRYLSYKPRTVFEMKTHLKKKAVSLDIIDKIIHTLLDKKYLDDADFADIYIRSQARHKPRSKFAFRYALKKKGISHAVIDQVLEAYDDVKLAKHAVEKKIHLWLSFDTEKFKKKIMNHLKYRGFDFEVSRQTLEYFITVKETAQKDAL